MSIAKFFSPKTPQGPIVLSALVHLAIAGSVMAGLHIRGGEAKSEENYVDLGYETFDAPPPPAEEVRRVVKSPTPTEPVVKNSVPDNSAKELQDEKGDVAGTQEAAKPQDNIGSESNGTAATTPFYKIKPKYPRAALATGVEGWVLLEIDITKEGQVDNIRVIDGEQRNMFQSEARRAVAQWKYRPFVDSSGKPFRKSDHQVRVDFKLEEQEESSDRASL